MNAIKNALAGWIVALLEKIFGPSWRTAAAGIGPGVFLLLCELLDLLGIKVDGVVTDGKFSLPVALTGASLILMGWWTRDNAVTSEQAKAAGEINPNPPKK